MENERAGAIRALVGGGIGVGITLVLFVIASVFEWDTVMFSGTLLLISWVSIGFGIGEFIFNGKMRIVILLLAVIIGIVGMAGSFVVMSKLGFDIRG